ncbi:MAG: CPBP family intramembrane metalloprotease [Oligoflexia bacterium]|nr:CPBP family intramembrane metalloprotease [Oligoflexia bacterium]
MNLSKYRRPILFYFLSTVIPWFFWFIAAYISRKPLQDAVIEFWISALGLLGLVAPVLTAFLMMYKDPVLRSDLTSRLIRFPKIKPLYFFITCFLMLGSILLAQALSLILGHSIEQFSLAKSASFSSGVFPTWFILILAPFLEELAWHSYGTDCLRARFSLFSTSLIFGLFWVIWHIPLGFIRGYYHSNVVAAGWIYSLNFALSLFPFVILMNWLYYKTDRNILVAVIFHITAGVFNEVFLTHPDSKVIQTILLLVLSVFIVMNDRSFFFKKELS